ncbi:MAG: hypothetical protein ACRDP1_14325 [Nocardioidaceae bacterium]
MHILMIGGTQFVGRHATAAALSAGHDVTLLHRGRTGAGLFPDSEHILADRDEDLSALTGRSFDATIDVCGYYPGQVRRVAEALGDGAGHYVFVSSVSAYAEPAAAGADESTALAPTAELGDDPDSLSMTGERYGPLKVLCEQAATQSLHGPVTLVRPTYVVGPDDPTGRFTWWVDRIARGGPVLCPGPAGAPAQVVDVRDQGGWIVGLVETGTTGAFHACGTAAGWSFADQLEAIADAVGGPGLELKWIDAGALKEAGVDGAQLPLWSEGESENALALDPGAARSTGLVPRPLADTIRDTQAWMATATWRREGTGLAAEAERALLTRLT